MRNIIIALVVGLFNFSAFASVTVGIVDMNEVMGKIKDGKSIMKTLEKSFEQKKETLKNEEEKIKKAQESYQKQAKVLSEKARAEKERELQQMFMGLQNKYRQYQEEMKKQELSLKKPILEKLQKIIKTVSEKQKVDLTFEKSSAPILFAANQKDITDEVVKAYEKK